MSSDFKEWREKIKRKDKSGQSRQKIMTFQKIVMKVEVTILWGVDRKNFRYPYGPTQSLMQSGYSIYTN